MQIIKYKYENLTSVQTFFIERFLELCHFKSIDSYRVKSLNPNSGLKELQQLIIDWNDNKIKNFETLIACKNEVKELVEKDECLKYGIISKQNLKDNINSVKSAKDKENLKKLNFTAHYLIFKNNNYKNDLLNVIESFLYNEEELNVGTKIELLQKLNVNLNYLVSELIHLGFSKRFLFQTVTKIFIYSPSVDFNQAWARFKHEINELKNTYFIFFSLRGELKKLENLEGIKEEINLLEEIPEEWNIKIPKLVETFLKPDKKKRLIAYKIEALDDFTALNEAKRKLASVLSLLHLAYSSININVLDNALIVNRKKMEKSKTFPISYQIDGNYEKTTEEYNKLSDSFNKIMSNSVVSKEVKKKLKSTIRYLRLGNEAFEIEQKFINYWIGLEHIFASGDINDSTFTRMKKYLTITHLVIYVKRNLVQFHKDIESADINKEIDSYNDNLDYLQKESTYNKIFENIEKYPLLAFRANQLKSKLLGKDKRKKHLEQHKTNLENHLIRIYRVRNELVHEAAQIDNIESFTGNLRYYLTFMLNKLLDYFSNISDNNEEQRQLNMNDFFQHQEMIWDNLKSENYELKKLLEIPNTVEYLS